MNNKKSVLIVYNRVPWPLKDGGALAMYRLLQSWIQHGFDVHVIAMNTTRHYCKVQDYPELFKQCASFQTVDVDNRIRKSQLLSNFLWSNKPAHAARFQSADFAQHLISFLNIHQPEWIQIESIYLHEYYALLRKHAPKAKLVQRLHNIEANIWKKLTEQESNFLKKYYLNHLAQRIKRYEQKLWPMYDALISISSPDHEYIKTLCPNTPLFCFPYGIEEFPSLQAWSQNLNCYHIGAMDWQPNQEAMLWMQNEIVPEILKLKLPFSFQFAGRKMPAYFQKFQEKSFQCMGEVPDTTAFTKDKQILIVPLRAASGIRVKSLEAMAAGKLVISTSLAMQGIDAQDGIHYLCADSAEAFAKAYQWCVQHPEQAQAIANNAQKLMIEKYNQDKLMLHYLNFLENL